MIRLLLLVVYNILRMTFCTLFNLGRWKVSFIQRISPFCSLKTYNDGQIEIGPNCEFSAYCDLEVHGIGTLSVGAKTYMNRYCMISAHEKVSIGVECMLGPGVKIFDNDHVYSSEKGVSTSLKTAPISIGNHCWLASNVIILRGSTIGDNCIIGAGCIVKGDVPAGTVMKR